MIPQIIHYCWLSGDEYPEDLKKYTATWKEMYALSDFLIMVFVMVSEAVT